MIIGITDRDIGKSVDLIVAVKKIIDDYDMTDDEASALLRELADEIAK